MSTLSPRLVARPGAAIALVSLALIAAIWALALERIAFEQGESIRDAVRYNSNLAVAFEEHTIRTVNGIDRALMALKRAYEREDRAMDLRAYIADGVLDPKLFTTGVLIDRNGDVAVTINAAGGSVNVADRDYFQHHRRERNSGLLISSPSVGRVTGKPTIHMSRRVDLPDGEFGGVAMVGIDPGYFASFYGELDLGKEGAVLLARTDGIVLARRAGGSVSAGQDISALPLFQLAAERPVGNFAATGKVDGVERYVSYRVVRGLPLLVAVGSAQGDVVRTFASARRNYLVAAVLATVLVALFAAALHVAQRRQRRAIAASLQSEARYRAAFSQAPVGVAHAARDGRIFAVNRRLCEMLGCSEKELIGQPWNRVIDPERHATLAVPDADTIEESDGRDPEDEKRYVRKDGSILWGVVTAALVRGADGGSDYFVTMLQDITERKKAQEQLVRQAHYDSLTELPNRILCYDRLTQAINQAKRREWSVAVLFVDLDRFKIVNDTLGHAIGDRLLHEAASRLARSVRAGDTIARLGGDEFAVILSELAQPQDARLVARKMLDAMAAPLRIDDHEVFVTASIGIATFPDDGSDCETLLKNADAAMFRAKKIGRNNCQFYTAAMNARAMERMLLENDLRHALERGEFELYYQPKADVDTGRLRGLEALLRWEHPVHRGTLPSEFVPLLEDSGVIVPVGAWVVSAACRQIRAWQDAGLAVVPVAINFSAKQFLHHDVATMVERAAREHGVDARLLEVEITETDAMQNPELTVAALARLRTLDVRISLDDFGTGYSSLAYLKRLPLDSLKLDRSFVKDLPADAEDASISLAVVRMAHSLGLRVIAEGVETEAQRDFLAACGCDEIQGFLLSRPLPAARCAALLAPAAAACSSGASGAAAAASRIDTRAAPAESVVAPGEAR